MRSPRRPRCDSPRWIQHARSASITRSEASLPANAPTLLSSHLPEARTILSRTRQSQPSSAARRRASWRRSWTDKPVTAKERPRGKRYAAPQAPPDDECFRRPAAEDEEAAARELGGSALLQPPAGPRQVGVRAARGRLRDELRALRRRLRLVRDRRHLPEPLQRHLEFGTLRFEAPEEGEREPEGREDVAAARDGARAEEQDRGGDRRPRPLHEAEAEGRERAPGAGRALPAPCRRLRARVRRSAVQGADDRTRVVVQAAAELAARRRVRGSDRVRNLPVHEQGHERRLREVHRDAGEGRRRLQAAVRPEPEGRDEPVPPGAGGTGRGRDGDRDRGVQDVPQAGPGRLARTGCEEGAEAADGSLNAGRERWLDSRRNRPGRGRASPDLAFSKTANA